MSVSRGPMKQKKKRNSVVSHSATPNTSESSIPSVDKNAHLQVSTVDEPLTGHEIESLLLRENDLTKLTYRKPPSPRLRETRRILVKKPVSPDNLQASNRKNVAVLRPLPSEAHVSSTRILGSVRPGPRYTEGDGLVPHSILGSVDEFTRSQSTTKQVVPSASEFSQSPVIFMPGTVGPQQRSQTPPSTQANALLNWEKRMEDRSHLQDKIARSVHTAPGSLAMHRGDHYRTKQEEREMINRLIPTVEGGKGVYKGGEFWRPSERIGDNLTGISTTLTKTQRGQPPDLEYITATDMMKEEMSISRHTPSVWGNSQYLNYRRQMLSQTIPSSLIGHSSCSQLQVTGQTISSCTHRSAAAPLRSPSLDSLGGEHYSSSDELNVDDDYDGGSSENILDSQPDVTSHPLVGPALRVADQLLTWDQEGEMARGPHVRVLFEADVTKLASSYLCMQNCGTTAIRYCWEHAQRVNPLGTKQAGTTQRFYFDTRAGVLHPGQKLSLQFMFKSVLPGVFIDQWRMQTEPALCGGRPFMVTLRGVAVQDDINWEKRLNIDVVLGHKMARSVASNVLERVVSGVATPPRTPSPDPLIKPEETVFLENNTGVFYHYNIIQQLKMLYVDIIRPPPIDPQASDMPEPSSKAATKKSEEKEKKGGGKKKEEKKGKQQAKEEASKDAAPQEKVVFVFPPDLDPWDLSLLTLQQLAMNIEDDNSREDKLKRLSAAVDALSLPSQPPHSLNSFTKSYMLLSDAVDQLSGMATHLRHIMGLPTREHSDTSPAAGGTEELAPRPPSQPTSPAHGGKKEKKGGKKGEAKENKSGKKEKETGVQKKRSSKSVNNKTITPPESTTDVRDQVAPVVEVNPVLEAKYRENLQAAVYEILGTAVETMAELMELSD